MAKCRCGLATPGHGPGEHLFALCPKKLKEAKAAKALAAQKVAEGVATRDEDAMRAALASFLKSFPVVDGVPPEAPSPEE